MTESELTTLQQITSHADRSDKHGFTDRSRLSVIRELLSDSPYSCIHTGKNAELYAKTDALPRDLLVVSGHCDVVSSIHAKKMFSTYDKECDTLTGNYDNAACNAAMVELMQSKDLPDNVVFAFTADEETGRCNGAKEVLNTLSGHRMMAIALDVTYENHTGCLYSIENICLKNNILSAIGSKMEDWDSALALPAGRYVRLRKSTNLSFVTNGKVSREHSWMDEGQVYGKHVPSVSFCLPLTGGDMHSDNGCHMKGRVYEGYIESLAGFIMLILGKEPDKAWNDRRMELSSAIQEDEKKREEEWKRLWNLAGSEILPDAEEGYADGWHQLSFFPEENERFQYLCDEASYYDDTGFEDFYEEITFDFPTEFLPETEEEAEALDEEIWEAWETTHHLTGNGHSDVEEQLNQALSEE